jgi:undecaprenyl-diphosphatase
MLPFFDIPVFQALNATAHSPLWWIQASRFASGWLPGLCALTVIAAMLTLGTGWRRSLQRALLSMVCAWLVCRLIRWGVPMPRPAQLGMGQQWIAHAASASFPSMHAAGAFALAQGFSLGAGKRQRGWVPVVWLLATAVALSRVVLGVHFPSDVLGGMLVGAASAMLVWRVSLTIRQAGRLKRLKQRLHPQAG